MSQGVMALAEIVEALRGLSRSLRSQIWRKIFVSVGGASLRGHRARFDNAGQLSFTCSLQPIKLRVVSCDCAGRKPPGQASRIQSA